MLTGRFVREFSRSAEVVIATKPFFPVDLAFKGGMGGGGEVRPNRGGLSRKRVFEAVDASLRRLGTDYIGLYQIHRWDYDTPVEETMEALHDVVKADKGTIYRNFQHVGLAVCQCPARCAKPQQALASYRCRTTTIWPAAKRSGS